MKRTRHMILKLLLLLITMTAAFATAGAAETTKQKAVYEFQTYEETFYGKNVVGTYRFELPVLSGDSKAVKKINDSLYQVYKESLQNRDNIKSYTEAGSYYRDAKYYATTDCKVTYNKKGVVSFCFALDWYAGGVHNAYHYGANYSLKTGKKLALKDVVKGASTNKQVKQIITDSYYKRLGSTYASYDELKKGINRRKMKDLYFYLKKGKVIVSTGSYAPLWGNGEVPIKLEGKY